MADPRGSIGPPDPRRRPITPGDTRQVALVPDNPDRLHWGKGFNRLLIVAVWSVLILIGIAGTAVYVVSGTDWGRERVRRYAEDFINARIHGRAKIGRLSGNLLVGVTVHDFSIVDTLGKPFIAVESARGKYSIISLFKKHLWFYDVVAIRPMIVLDRPPNRPWNWKGIFPRDTTPKPASQQTEWGDWLRFTTSSVIGGQLIIRSPWRPSRTLAPAAHDSAIREAMRGRGRLLIKRVPGGFQKIVQLDSVTAAVPLLRLSEPGFKDRLLEVSAMRMIAYPFRPPAAIVRDVKGVFPFNNDSIWWKGAYAALPSSKATGGGIYNFDTGDLAITLSANPARFADNACYRPLPPADPGILAAREKYGLDGPFVFNVGGLDVRKNLAALIRAFALVRAQLPPEMRLVIAGAAHSDHPDRYPDLAPTIAECGLGDRVVFTGRISEEEKVALLNAAELYVYPSLYEGFGLSPLEAMCCGTPVISSDRSSLPEVVGEGGLLVDPTPAKLGAAMTFVLQTPHERRELRRSALAQAARFSWARTAQLTAAAYEEAVVNAERGTRNAEQSMTRT